MKNAKEYKERRDYQEYCSGYDMLNSKELKELRLDVKERKLQGEKELNGAGIRATVAERCGAKILTSYYTEVAMLKDGKLFKLWNGWSATTAKHIKKFCEKYGIRIPSKYEWIMTDTNEPIKYERID